MSDPQQPQAPHDDQASEPATMGQVKSIVRRRLRKQEQHTDEGLNIYPMMDMMTILLVFMIMQMSASTDVTQSAELQIPYSTSIEETIDSVPIQITTNTISVDGTEVLQLRNGQVDPSLKQGGGTGFLITPLFARMEQHRDRLKLIAQARQETFSGEVQIIADKRTPFRTLAEVIYTLGQAEFKTMRFVVLKRPD